MIESVPASFDQAHRLPSVISQLNNDRMKYSLSLHNGLSKLRVENSEHASSMPGETRVLSHPKITHQVYQRPFYLGVGPGVMFVLILLGAVATLITLNANMRNQNGLPLPSSNATINQLVLNYIPVVFSTFLEPYWVLLNRMLCLLKPFEELSRCRARAKNTLDLKYSSLPPQLTTWRAIRARHFLLASVGLVALSNSTLAVALSGLFTTATTNLELQTSISILWKPQLTYSTGLEPIFEPNGYLCLDHFYTAISNVTHNTPLLAWTTKDTFYLPRAFENSAKADN